MKILCIGDSLGLPREDCPYELTWFYELKQSFHEYDFIEHFVRGLAISDAFERFETYFQFYNADIVVIQTGVCDCAPRYINERKIAVKALIRLCTRTGLLGLFWRLVKLGKRKPECVITKYEDFYRLYDGLVSKFINQGTHRIILVKIGHAAGSTIKSSPFFNSNVDRYNKALCLIQNHYPDNVVIIDPLGSITEDDFVDGYHCNPQGMHKVFNSIKIAIENYAATK